MRNIFVLLLLALATISICHADINKEMQDAATNGNPVAQCDLGMQYYQAGDYDNAFRWFKKSADAGNPMGQYNLGICYEKGHGTSKDILEAVILYREAAERGLPEAQYMLAGCYKDGIGTQQNLQRAREWYEKAANQNYGLAQFAIADEFLNPHKTNGEYEGQENDYYRMIRKAYDNGIRKAAFGLGRCYLEIKSIQDDILGLSLIRKAIANGDDEAMTYMANLYSKGKHVNEDLEKAYQLYLKASELGNIEAKFHIGEFYEYGIYSGIRKDEEEAYRIYNSISSFHLADDKIKERELRLQEERRNRLEEQRRQEYQEQQRREKEERLKYQRQREVINDIHRDLKAVNPGSVKVLLTMGRKNQTKKIKIKENHHTTTKIGVHTITGEQFYIITGYYWSYQGPTLEDANNFIRSFNKLSNSNLKLPYTDLIAYAAGKKITTDWGKEWSAEGQGIFTYYNVEKDIVEIDTWSANSFRVAIY